MTRVLYPGSFDPITKGHMDIIWQASNLFDEVVVAVMQNYSKKISFFSIEERLEMIKYLYRDMSNIKVISGSGATVDVAIQNECKAIIRGLRSLSDYDYEVTMQEINREISNNMINTICLGMGQENIEQQAIDCMESIGYCVSNIQTVVFDRLQQIQAMQNNMAKKQ